MVQMCKRTQWGTLKPSILVGNLEEDALSSVIPNFEVDAFVELSNQDHEVEEELTWQIFANVGILVYLASHIPTNVGIFSLVNIS
jgi:hypothetical protein